MTILTFNQELAIALYESTENFPVDFDDAWQWLGYAKKQNAKDKLIRNFDDGLDFRITQMRETKQDGTFSHSYEKIELTIDCFKSLGMMVGTEQGRIIRKYFLECERTLKHKVHQHDVSSDLRRPDIRDIGLAIDTVFAVTSVDVRLQAAVKANQIAKIYPALASAMEESKSLLSIPVEDKLIRPGKLAELYEARTGVKLSAQKMNSLLAEKGLQVKNTANNNPLWLPTEEGKQYSQVVLDTAKGHNKTVQSLQWYPSVVDVI